MLFGRRLRDLSDLRGGELILKPALNDFTIMFSKMSASFLAVLVITSAAALHSAAGTVVSGTVSGTDQGFLTGASIVIDGPVRRSARTDADGRFTFAEVPSGQYRIEVTADGYLPLERPLEVHTASVSMDIVLLRIPSVP